MSEVSITVTVEKALLNHSSLVLKRIGLSPNEAINMFLRRVVREERLPFTVEPTLSQEEKNALKNWRINEDREFDFSDDIHPIVKREDSNEFYGLINSDHSSL
ncbi:MAG: type II toxin-antitoxin system RelB/DinJ family antitoxin [Clostridiales bacterium]|jgi:addiction module RelB/DinJ family antitoxin|nr:type II toxin-antitoxin system RelB/DinJ family antitoxin [Clostridiales bacterium]MDR2751160.1 type II toxin-antitoxin system RelB/DinJ family antitoxin [Clostridiales bacterium]